ncbi:MAG: hypothetical protein PHS41_06300 [Victivallaceae bacterium]|nr:hypothetical protein [Victivallaceae bacterium]
MKKTNLIGMICASALMFGSVSAFAGGPGRDRHHDDSGDGLHLAAGIVHLVANVLRPPIVMREVTTVPVVAAPTVVVTPTTVAVPTQQIIYCEETVRPVYVYPNCVDRPPVRYENRRPAPYRYAPPAPPRRIDPPPRPNREMRRR